MKALFIKGTTLRGKIVNAGDTLDVPDADFRIFKLQGQAVEAPLPEPIPAPVPAPSAPPLKKLRKKGRL